MLDLSFYARDATTVARALLGQHLITHVNGKTQRSRIVETEAYLGVDDLASHASKGRTKRTEVIFGPPGVAYVYLIYGMYDMLNIVTADVDTAHAVLIRAVEPLSECLGQTNGPGKLCKALGITRAHNGLPLFGPQLWLEAAPGPKKIVTTTRIGIDYAKEWKDAPLRFYDAKSQYVSKR
jgi:DNA-3-methyladenine glycosylase